MGCDEHGPTPYQDQKIHDRYGSYSSQADIMQEDAKMPGMYSGSGSHFNISDSIYKPHSFTPSQHGLIGAPCMVCGSVPSDPVHTDDSQKLTFDLTAPGVTVEKLADNKVSYEITLIPNDQAMRVVLEVLPKVLRLYLSKSRDYNGNVMSMLKLGPKASFVDLWRKVGKLKSALWDGQPMQGEQADEILSDCIGHILITLDEMEQQC